MEWFIEVISDIQQVEVLWILGNGRYYDKDIQVFLKKLGMREVLLYVVFIGLERFVFIIELREKLFYQDL